MTIPTPAATRPPGIDLDQRIDLTANPDGTLRHAPHAAAAEPSVLASWHALELAGRVCRHPHGRCDVWTRPGPHLHSPTDVIPGDRVVVGRRRIGTEVAVYAVTGVTGRRVDLERVA